MAGNVNTNRLNEDIMNFVNGWKGMDASKQGMLYHLMAFHRARNESELSDRLGEYLDKSDQPIPELDNEGNTEHSVGEVRFAFEAYYRNVILAEKQSVDIEQMLEMTQRACRAVFVQQLEDLSIGTSNVDDQLDKVIEYFSDKVPARNSNGDYITSLDAFLQNMSDRFDEFEFDGPAQAVFDDSTIRTALYRMLQPWFIMRFLAGFNEGPWNASGNSFHPNFQESQYARLAMFRIMFDSINHVQKYFIRTGSNPEDLVYISDLAYRVTDTIGREYVSQRKDKYPEWQNKVSDKSTDTKDKSMRLFQINVQLEKRKENLLAMMHNHRELQNEEKRQRWIFWAMVIAYIIIVIIIMALIVKDQYFILYLFSGALVVVPLMWYIISLVRRTIS